MTDQETLAHVDLKPETRAFLRDWLDWVERGAPDRGPYSREDGLCWAADRAGKKAVRDNLELAFQEMFPFGYSDFWARVDKRTQHECPKRLAFARANAKGAA